MHLPAQCWRRMAPSEEVLPLLLPLDRERLQKLREPCRRTPIQNPLDDIRGEERETQQAADVGAADPFGVRQIGEGPRERLDERAVRLRLRRGRKLAAVRCYDALAAASTLESHRNADDQRPAVEPGLYAAAALFHAVAVHHARRCTGERVRERDLQLL